MRSDGRRSRLLRRRRFPERGAVASKPAAAPNPQLDQYKRNVGLEVDAMQENIQRMERLGVQLRRARIPGVRDDEVPRPAILRQNGFTIAGGRRRHPDGVDGAMGIGQAGDRARLGRRLHPAGVAEAGRRLARTDHRRRARPRRRTQLGDAAADRGRARREEGDGATASAGHADAVARHRRRTGRHQGVLRARGAVQGRRHLDLRARRRQPRRELGRRHAERPGVGRVQRSRARARTPPARRGAASRRSTRWN